MPSLHAFGRHWNLASDDFVFPAITEALVRLLLVIFALFVFTIHYPLHCEPHSMAHYVVVLVIINLVSIVLCVATALHSSRGTILDPAPRHHVSTCLYARVPVYCLELGWTIVVTTYVFKGISNCNFLFVLRVAIVLEWLLIAVLFVVVLTAVSAHSPDDAVHDQVTLSRRTWSRRLQILKIRQDELMRSALDDVAELIASFFTDDYVVSDVLAGLLLLVHSPRNAEPPIVEVKLGGVERPDWMNVDRAHYYFVFANSIYGWPSYLTDHCGPRGWCKLASSLRIPGRLRCQQDVLVVEDNCCACHSAALSLTLNEHQYDLFFASFRNRLYEVPFLVVCDHSSRSVVVAIRGSASLSDLVTDMCMDDEAFTVDVDSDDVLREDQTLDSEQAVRVHRGMLRSARYVFDTLRRRHILDDVFVLCPGYKLVVCGHSLGAGVASLLTLLLKQQYADVQCFAYSPPGCVISQSGIREMSAHVMSVLVGDDMVCRLSFQSLHRLRERVDDELRLCRRAKYQILIGGVFRIFFPSPWQDDETLGASHRTDGDLQRMESADGGDRTGLVGRQSSVEPPQHNYGSMNGDYVSTGETSTNGQHRVRLFAPGHLMQIYETEGTTRTRWIEASCLREVKLSKSAVNDHLPHNVSKALKKIVEQSDRGGAGASSNVAMQI